jgi:hypothetical protein
MFLLPKGRYSRNGDNAYKRIYQPKASAIFSQDSTSLFVFGYVRIASGIERKYQI